MGVSVGHEGNTTVETLGIINAVVADRFDGFSVASSLASGMV